MAELPVDPETHRVQVKPSASDHIAELQKKMRAVQEMVRMLSHLADH